MKYLIYYIDEMFFWVIVYYCNIVFEKLVFAKITNPNGNLMHLSFEEIYEFVWIGRFAIEIYILKKNTCFQLHLIYSKLLSIGWHYFFSHHLTHDKHTYRGGKHSKLCRLVLLRVSKDSVHCLNWWEILLMMLLKGWLIFIPVNPICLACTAMNTTDPFYWHVYLAL